jgi:hypothetical protein
MIGPSFRDAELEGWDRKAGYWNDSLGLVTRLRQDLACVFWTLPVAPARLPRWQLGVVLKS